MSELGEHELAIADGERAVTLSNRQAFLVSALGCACGRGGRRADAERLLDQLRQRSEREYIAPLHIADVYASLGERSLACEWIERGYADRSGFMPELARAARYDVLRDEPQFQAVLARLNLT